MGLLIWLNPIGWLGQSQSNSRADIKAPKTQKSAYADFSKWPYSRQNVLPTNLSPQFLTSPRTDNCIATMSKKDWDRQIYCHLLKWLGAAFWLLVLWCLGLNVVSTDIRCKQGINKQSLILSLHTQWLRPTTIIPTKLEDCRLYLTKRNIKIHTQY